MNAFADQPLRVAVVGLGQMGRSHGLAYHHDPNYRIVGVHDRLPVRLLEPLTDYPRFDSVDELLALKPDVVAVCTYAQTHAALAIRAMEAGAHVFVEKPLATTLADAREVIATARRTARKLVIGYILRHHPSWELFIERARDMGPPYVMRFNLNQQSSGAAWAIHRHLLESTSPVVDCGIHYVDVMCRIVGVRPVQIRGMGLRLSYELDESQLNYGHLQVLFEDGSLGWYEAGWGPMISETACFVKDVIGPRGAVSIVLPPGAKSADVDTHTKTGSVRIHFADLSPTGQLARDDEWLSMDEEPGHNELCAREQRYLAAAIREDRNLDSDYVDALRSLEIVLASERSHREKCVIDL